MDFLSDAREDGAERFRNGGRRGAVFRAQERYNRMRTKYARGSPGYEVCPCMHYQLADNTLGRERDVPDKGIDKIVIYGKSCEHGRH